MPKALVVDDEPACRSFLSELLEGEGLQAVSVANGLSALEHVKVDTPAVILLDLRMPGLDGMVALEKLKDLAPQVPVIILTGHGDISSAVSAMRLGAHDYLTKPCDAGRIETAVRHAINGRHVGHQIEGPRPIERGALSWLMGPSPEIQAVVQQVKQVARSTLTVLIQGETGTGKELVARAIHELGVGREKPFVAVDCGAIPDALLESELFGYERGAFTGADRRKEGRFELAHSGSLFLDEIVNLPMTTQSKLLRVLQERQVEPLGAKHPIPVNLRIIAASNVPLDREIRAGHFRQDLYYRLNEFIITLPSLRQRRDDIVSLANRFLAEGTMELRRPVHAISEEARHLLLHYPWPGNVRELRNVIRRAILLSDEVIRAEHLPALAGPTAGLSPQSDIALSSETVLLRDVVERAVSQAERQAIREALRSTQGNKSEAARRLGIDYKTLHLKMKRYGIDAREFLTT
jgi:DNA-binding NtrC family response regulator